MRLGADADGRQAEGGQTATRKAARGQGGWAGVVLVLAVTFAAPGLQGRDARAQTQSRPKPVAPPVKSSAPAPTAQPPAAPQTPASSTQQPATAENVTETMLGVPFYPTMQFIESYNAGSGQRYYLFGTTSSFADVVAYYRSVLKQRGELVFEVPATHEFDIGRFDENTMAFPPSVTVKDHAGTGLQGYPNPKPGGGSRLASTRSSRSCQ